MTEPVSHTAEVRKFLFFKDSRPIAPTNDAKITAAVQEIIHGVGMGFTSVFLLCLPLSLIPLFGEGPIGDLRFGLLALIYILASVGMISANSKIGPRLYQSGIPNRRTFVSDALSVVMAVAVASAFVLIFELWPLNGGLSQQNDAGKLALLANGFLLLLWSLRSIQERIQWILDLRAEQGHVLAQGADGEAASPNAEPVEFGS
ncbi:hypothetical protein [Aquidulcibacter sp.]|uniref:hypothetical protein n=1 Tax=Aquidulcibacter sp. TaxID=2052990 RepID=UPI0025BA7DA9|nr:hypothetical protein [Aquidulcibacter sp.]MCA3696145.1 hypothetical protein [Aquidulcibacter sp.]